MNQLIKHCLPIISLFISIFLQAQETMIKHKAKKVTVNLSTGSSSYLKFGNVLYKESERPNLDRKRKGAAYQLEALYNINDQRKVGLLVSQVKYESTVVDTDISIDFLILDYYIPFPIVNSRTVTTNVKDKSYQTALIYKELLGKRGRQKVFWGTGGIGFWHIDRFAQILEDDKDIRRYGKKTFPYALAGLEMQVPIFKYFQFGVKSNLMYTLTKDAAVSYNFLPSIGIKF